MSQKLSFKTQLLPTMLSIGDQEPFAANSLKPMGFMMPLIYMHSKDVSPFRNQACTSELKPIIKNPRLYQAKS